MSAVKSDYRSGIHSVLLNPATSSLLGKGKHINFLSAHVHAQTDYAYVSNSNLWSVIGNAGDIEIIGNPDNIQEINATRQLIFDQDGGRKDIGFNSSITLPSVIWDKGENIHIGILINSRGLLSSYRIPEEMGYYELYGIQDSTTVLNPFDISASWWTELGVHFSKIIEKDGEAFTSYGATGKILLPHEGGSVSGLNQVSYSNDDNIYSVDNWASSAGYTTFGSGYSGRINGIGLGIDLGYMNSDENQIIGISLLDLGFIRIGRNAESYRIGADSSLVFSDNFIPDPTDLESIINEVDNQLDPQTNAFLEEGTSFSLALPTAISIQYTRKFNSKFSVSSYLVNRLPINSVGLKRPNSLAIIPRFNLGAFTLSGSATLREYKTFTYGVSLRHRFFFIGSDDVSSLFGSRDFDGTDFYIGFTYSPKKNKSNSVECFTFE